MDSLGNSEILLLLEDYGRSLRRRVSAVRSVELAPSERPIWLRVADFQHKLEWQFRQNPEATRIAPSNTPPPELLVHTFDATARLRRAPGSGIWPADSSTPLDIETKWASRKIHPWAATTVLHAMAMTYLLIPATRQLETVKPPDWDSIQITLSTPILDDLPPLRGASDVSGEGEGGFRGLSQPAVEPAPGPSQLPDVPVEPEEVAEVSQPVEAPESEEPEKPAALEAEEEPQVAEAPVSQSPDPGEFQEGTELAQSRDPRLLPMPKAPSRKRPALQLEDPKARMPSRSGPGQLGTLELTAGPGQAVEDALQTLIRGGGGRQAVGDGIGGLPSAGVLPSGPSNSGSAVELLSDPRGVDFRPYLTQILAAVRRNWFAVIPESARMGMNRGRTLIQFSVSRNGSVPKLVIAKTSGHPPLDRAAVAGISASNPFPPLPGEYLGQDIRLQFTFLYNIRNP